MRTPHITTRLARRIGALAVAMIASLPIVLGAQTLTISPSNSRADSIPAPKKTNYDATVSATTASWTLRINCQNSIGGQNNYCVLRMQAPVGTLATVQVVAQTPTGGNFCSGGAQTFTLSTSPVEIMRVAKAGGAGNTCDVVVSFRVSGLSYAAYQSSGSAAASTFTRSIALSAAAIP